MLVFFNETLVYSKGWAKHLEHLEMVLEVLVENQLYAKLSKCKFGLPEVDYLGHVINGKEVMAYPNKVTTMLEWPIPTRGFLGLTGYYRKFIKNYEIIAASLTDLLKENPFVWNDKAMKAFNELKSVVIRPLTLKLPDFPSHLLLSVTLVGGEWGPS